MTSQLDYIEITVIWVNQIFVTRRVRLKNLQLANKSDFKNLNDLINIKLDSKFHVPDIRFHCYIFPCIQSVL